MISRTLFALVFLAGCTSDSSPAETPTTDDSAVTEAAPTSDPASPAPPPLALDARGLSELTPTGVAAPLPFGFEGERIVAAVTRRLGAPTERGTNDECGAGPLHYATWDGGLTLWLQGDRFMGWTFDGDAGRLTTVTNLSIGSTRAQLDAASPASVTESTLGTEFEADGLHGILSGPEPDATVTTLWAGISCNFR